MARIICVANQKRGVGKTTTAINLGAGLAKAGRPTLLLDLDPQCNATTGLGLSPSERHPLATVTSLRESSVECGIPDLWVIPGSSNIQDVKALAGGETDLGMRLRSQMDEGMGGFDYVLVDCPPSLGSLTEIALSISTEVLLTVPCDFFAMEGISQLIEMIRRVMQKQRDRLEFGGVLLTMSNHLFQWTARVEEEVREFFGEIVFDAVIPRDRLVAEAANYGKSVIDFAPRTHGARAYIELCMEVLGRD